MPNADCVKGENLRDSGGLPDVLLHSGLLELVRDLIEYAYRDMIGTAPGHISHQNYASELLHEFSASEPMQEF